jgi:hypothetical protein
MRGSAALTTITTPGELRRLPTLWDALWGSISFTLALNLLCKITCILALFRAVGSHSCQVRSSAAAVENIWQFFFTIQQGSYLPKFIFHCRLSIKFNNIRTYCFARLRLKIMVTKERFYSAQNQINISQKILSANFVKFLFSYFSNNFNQMGIFIWKYR